jgi:hypothetical protein
MSHEGYKINLFVLLCERLCVTLCDFLFVNITVKLLNISKYSWNSHLDLHHLLWT